MNSANGLAKNVEQKKNTETWLNFLVIYVVTAQQTENSAQTNKTKKKEEWQNKWTKNNAKCQFF